MGVMDARRRILMSAPHIATPASAGLVSFSTDMIAPLKECKVHFAPVQSGTGDPSPTNIRPISGWDGLTVTRCGKNIFNISQITACSVDTLGEVLPDKLIAKRSGSYSGIYWIGWKGKLPVGTTITISADVLVPSQEGLTNKSVALGIRYDGTAPSQYVFTNVSAFDNLERLSATITVNSYEEFWLVVQGAGNVLNEVVEFSNIQLELSSTATAYDPYTGSTYPVSWQSEAGTIYGGYVDVAKGEVVETVHGYTFTGAESVNNFSTALNAAMYAASNLDSAIWASKYGGVAQACNYAVAASRITIDNYSNALVVGDTVGGNGNVLLLKIDGITSANGMKAWLKEKYDGGTPVIALYTLATPIQRSIDQTALATLRGMNNIWSNANGNIDLSYWTH